MCLNLQEKDFLLGRRSFGKERNVYQEGKNSLPWKGFPAREGFLFQGIVSLSGKGFPTRESCPAKEELSFREGKGSLPGKDFGLVNTHI